MDCALIGCGTIARSHLRGLRRMRPDARIHLVDVDRQRAETLASGSAITSIHTDIDAFLNDVRPDTVHVLTPPPTHAMIAEKALNVGSHLFIEKPVTERAEQYAELAELAREKKRILCADYSTLGMPVVMRALKEIHSGAFGKLVAVHCVFAGSEGGGVIPYGFSGHWAYFLRGGILQNNIDHPASLVLAVMDEIEEQHVSIVRRNILPYDCPDLIQISLRSRDQVGNITLSLGHGAHDRRAHFLLEGGTITIDIARQLYSSVKSRGPQSFVEKATSGIAEGCALAGGTIKNTISALTGKLQRDPGIMNVMASFYQAVEGNGKPIVSDSVVRKVTRFLDVVWSQVDYQPTNAEKRRMG